MGNIIVYPNRRLNIPSGILPLGVETENVVEKIIFEIPRFVGSNPLDSYSADVLLLIQAETFQDEIKLTTKSLSEDEDIVYAEWLVERKSLEYPNITIQVKISHQSLDQVWITLQRELTVADVINVDETISNTYPTILDQLRNEVNALTDLVNTYESRITTIEESYIVYK